MESLVPFLCDDLCVKVPFQSVLKDRTEVLIRVDYFSRFTVYLDSQMSVPLTSKIYCHLFAFARIQVKVRVITPIHENIEGRTMTILRSLKKGKQSTVISKLNYVTILLVTSAVICIQNVEERTEDTTRGEGGGVQ